MYLDDYGRNWEGPIPFDLEMIATQTPRSFGVYQVLAPAPGGWAPAYIGIETGDTIESFLEDFPGVSREQAIAFLEQATTSLLGRAA